MMCLGAGYPVPHAVIPVRSRCQKQLSMIIDRRAVTPQTTMTLVELIV
jgi:hypothetical protein